MKDKTVLQRAIDAIQRLFGVFSSIEPTNHFNPVLAKWEKHYDSRPSSFAHRRQSNVLSYYTHAD